MINLPKPSLLNTKDDSKANAEYLVRYLTSLVAALENYLGGLNTKKAAAPPTVVNIASTDTSIVFVWSDGRQQSIPTE